MSHATCYYHGNCPDGFAAACCARKALAGAPLALIPALHGMPLPEPDPKSETVYFLDYCPSPDFARRIAEAGSAVIVIDHHLGALPQIQAIASIPGCKAVYDAGHSGCALAFRHFFPGKEMPKLLSFIEDRDLCRNSIPDAEIALLWLDVHPFEFSLWEAFMGFSDETWNKIVDSNGPMAKKFKSIARKASAQSIPCSIAGAPARLAFATEETAPAVALCLSQTHGCLGVALSLQPNGWAKASLRSAGPDDLVPIAQSLGGGGHPFASAFPMPPGMVAHALEGRDLAEYSE